MNKCWSKLINWEEIWNFTPINQLLRPDYLGVGTTGEESGGEGRDVRNAPLTLQYKGEE